ncbi:MAG: hypothetical protein ABGZ36_10005 [Actinomycetota bacterium]|uniref:hypothetical protein n=1 Tax=Euzebya pacifica TaxID=1608957 RepID=UPI0030F4ED1E
MVARGHDVHRPRAHRTRPAGDGLLRLLARLARAAARPAGATPDDERIAPYANYFTDPFVDFIARRLRIPERAAAAVSLLALAVVIAGLGRASSAL